MTIEEKSRRAHGQEMSSSRVETGAVDLSVVMPCLNEEETVGQCVSQALQTFQKLGLAGEVIVVDNGSSDTSAAVARRAGARVVVESATGYGRALRRGIGEARGDIFVFADADGSHDFEDLGGLVLALERGADVVIGRRSADRAERGAIPWLHRYVGVPLLTGILNLLHGTRVSDAHCGMRAITRSACAKLDLRSGGMEFASEMIIEAARHRLLLTEVAIRALPRAGGDPKLRTWSDGWRHLRLIAARARRRRVRNAFGFLSLMVGMAAASAYWGVYVAALLVAALLTAAIGVAASSSRLRQRHSPLRRAPTSLGELESVDSANEAAF